MQLQHAGKTATRDLASGQADLGAFDPQACADDDDVGLHARGDGDFVGALGQHKPQVRVMDQADIEQMIEWFAAAAARAQAAGFDGVELHAAHTYILAGFLSPYYNRRDDAYGGPIENRARLLVETIRAVKKRTGADFPVWVRLDGEELRTEGGITLADAIAAAKLAEQAGADAISMSAYATITTAWPSPKRRWYNSRGLVGYAAAVKKEVKRARSSPPGASAPRWPTKASNAGCSISSPWGASCWPTPICRTSWPRTAARTCGPASTAMSA
jgi:2,4-dienoyl-CoA reductase-like NADH-dependent reductase (Old Yellow Enzyme family)